MVMTQQEAFAIIHSDRGGKQGDGASESLPSIGLSA